MNTPSKQLITRLMKQFPNDPDKVHERLAFYGGICAALAVNDREFDAENKRHDKACEEIKRRRREIRQTCDHPDTTRHGDPSGGSDFCTICNICDSEVTETR